MSPSTAPPFCSLTRTARIVPLTRPQTVTSCAMTLPSTCAPSLIRRSEARNSPWIRPKTCAGPVHSMLPTIDMPEPMQEPVPAFVVGSGLAPACSTTECCCCTVLSMTSAAFLRCLTLEATQHVHLPFSSACTAGKGQGCLLAFERELAQSLLLSTWGDPQVRTPFENRTAQKRAATLRRYGHRIQCQGKHLSGAIVKNGGSTANADHRRQR